MRWDDPEAVSTRRRVATRVSRQVHRLERALPEIADAADKWLEHNRAGQAVWLLTAKEAELAGLVVAGYRSSRYSAVAALTRTLYEDATLAGLVRHP